MLQFSRMYDRLGSSLSDVGKPIFRPNRHRRTIESLSGCASLFNESLGVIKYQNKYLKATKIARDITKSLPNFSESLSMLGSTSKLLQSFSNTLNANTSIDSLGECISPFNANIEKISGNISKSMPKFITNFSSNKAYKTSDLLNLTNQIVIPQINPIDLNTAITKSYNEYAKRLSAIANHCKARYYEILYKEYDANPLFAFKAYEYLRKGQIPIPDWLLVYFDEISENLLKEAEITNKNRGERASSSIQQALGFNLGAGRKNAFARFQEIERNLDICSEAGYIIRMISEGKFRLPRGESVNSIVGEKFGLSESQVRNIRRKTEYIRDYEL